MEVIDISLRQSKRSAVLGIISHPSTHSFSFPPPLLRHLIFYLTPQLPPPSPPAGSPSSAASAVPVPPLPISLSAWSHPYRQLFPLALVAAPMLELDVQVKRHLRPVDVVTSLVGALVTLGDLVSHAAALLAGQSAPHLLLFLFDALNRHTSTLMRARLSSSCITFGV